MSAATITSPDDEALGVLRRFSRLAGFALVAIAAAGAALTWNLSDGLAGGLTSPWMLILGGKVALVGAAAILGFAGLADDLLIAAYTLNLLVNRIDPSIIREHWPGEGDVLATVQDIATKADRLLGRGLWDKIKAIVDKIFA